MSLHDYLYQFLKQATGSEPLAGQLEKLFKRIDKDASDRDGAANGTGVSVEEFGAGPFHMTELTLDDLTVALTDEATVVAHGNHKLYDFPEGGILILGALSDLDLTKDAAGVNDTWDGDFALGTAAAAADTTLTGTEDDVLPSTATPQAVGGATTANGLSTSSEMSVHDGTTTAKDLYLNVLVDDADHDVGATATNLIFNGTIRVFWIDLGDF